MDRLLEGSLQARVFVEKLTIAAESKTQLQSLDEAITAIRASLQMIGTSDEFRAHFRPSPGRDGGEDSTSVRVRALFLQNVIESANAAGRLLDTSVNSICVNLPMTTKESLLNITASLFSNLENPSLLRLG